MIVILNFSGQLLLVLIKLTRVCFRPHSQGPLLPGPSLAPGAEQEKEDDVNTLCDKLATDYSVCTGRATSCTLMSLQKVAATCCCNSCRVVCTDPQDFIETFLSLMMVFHLSGTAKNRSQDCRRFNLWKLTKWSFRWTVHRKTQRCDDLYRGRG